MKKTTSCCCGQLRVEFTGEITRTSICHCLECQKRTGSAFGFQTRVERDKTTIHGESRIFTRIGDEGSEIKFHFCPQCGSTIYWEAEWLGSAIALALGGFGDPSLPAPVREVYENRRHHWIPSPL